MESEGCCCNCDLCKWTRGEITNDEFRKEINRVMEIHRTGISKCQHNLLLIAKFEKQESKIQR